MNKPFEVCLLLVLLFPKQLKRGRQEKVNSKLGLKMGLSLPHCPCNRKGYKLYTHERYYW